MAKAGAYAVIGLGAFGRQVCATIAGRGGRVIAIDRDPTLLERVKELVTQTVLVDTTDEEAMQALPWNDVTSAVVAIGDNVEASILATAILKRVGVPRIISRAVSDIHNQVLRKIGADETINIEIDAGERLGTRLIAPDVLESVPISAEVSMAEIMVPGAFVGRSIATLDLRKRVHVNVAAVRRDKVSVDVEGNARTEETVMFPEPDLVLEENDVLLAVGSNADIESLREL